MKRKRKKRPRIKKLQNKLLTLWKSYCYLRDGHHCQVQLTYPQVSLPHTLIYQVDHCFSRSIKDLFTDPANGTVVCSSCNRGKFFRHKGLDVLIQEIVINREGREKFNQMLKTARSNPSGNWKRAGWVEEQIDIMSQKISDLGRQERYDPEYPPQCGGRE